jgi:hypothetical protein
MIKTTETLGRITKLNAFLTPLKLMRSKAVTELQVLGINAQQKLSSNDFSLDIVKNIIKEDLSRIKTGVMKDKNLLEIYEKVIDGARTPEELDKCIMKLHKDTSSLTTFNLKKTNNGQNGPTYLINYTRPSKKNTLPQLRNYVVKWSNWNEICSLRLYDLIVQTLFPQIFAIPKTAALDFDKQIHEKGDGDVCALGEVTSAYLKQSFLDIVGKSIQTDDAQLMLMEKVKGSNLIDFAQTKYQYLTAGEKSDLFQKMGNLAMIDLLIGNTDRLIQTRYDANTKEYLLENTTSNLGNLMIDWFPDECKFPTLYAIDNGIKKELISNEIEKVSYNQFIQNLLEDSNKMETLADMMVQSMKNSFHDIAELMAESSKETLTVTRAKFDSIMNDLQNSDAPKVGLINGLKEMSSNFKEVILPFWNSEDALKLKNYLKDNHPPLLDAVSERFQILNFKG